MKLSLVPTSLVLLFSVVAPRSDPHLFEFATLGSALHSDAQVSPAIRVPGTRVSLVPPAGFTPAKLFSGYEREDRFSSIMILPVLASIEALLPTMTKQDLAKGGVELISKTEITRGSLTGATLLASQTFSGTKLSKCMLVIGNETRSVMIVGMYPRELEDELGSAVQSAVFAAAFDPDLEVGLFDALSFRVRSTEKLELQSEPSFGAVTLLAPDATLPLRAGDPMVVVVQSYSQVAIDDLEHYSIERARQTRYHTNFRVVESKAVELGGIQARELILKANDTESNAPVRLYQVLAVAGDRYYMIQGLISEAKFDEYLPEFRAVTDSFTLVEAAEAGDK